MILQSLTRLHDRLLAEGRLEAPGFQAKEILWLIALDPADTPPAQRIRTRRTRSSRGPTKRSCLVSNRVR